MPDSATEISPRELKDRLDAGENLFVLDVRQPDEFETANIGGHLIPMNELPYRLEELNKDDEIIVHCHHGGRSLKAIEYLRGQGFNHLKNLTGGIQRWSEEVDSDVPQY